MERCLNSSIHSFIHLLQFVFVIFNRPDTEIYVAEKFGIGITTGNTFILKEHVRDDIQKMCLPKLMQNEMNGIVTHVRHTFYVYFHIFFFNFSSANHILAHYFSIRLKIVQNSGFNQLTSNKPLPPTFNS